MKRNYYICFEDRMAREAAVKLCKGLKKAGRRSMILGIAVACLSCAVYAQDKEIEELKRKIGG